MKIGQQNCFDIAKNEIEQSERWERESQRDRKKRTNTIRCPNDEQMIFNLKMFEKKTSIKLSHFYFIFLSQTKFQCEKFIGSISIQDLS